ncbi:L-sorbosone dehydrogenase [Pseudomonas sp. BAY1663]|nr:L-sorbosone dehydrogenase [Pseudomonas sp. BAY1663]
MHDSRLVLLIGAALLALGGCSETATLPVESGYGPNPPLPEPHKTLLPTVNIAPATGWPDGAKPQAAAGLRVEAFARDLDHPRWLHVLPNGDVLVAESDAPPKEGKQGIRGWIMKKIMARAGSGNPSANRITLLRDSDGDGVPERRTVFLENLHSPFGMALVGSDFYVANTDALLRFSYEEGMTRIAAEGEKVVDLPAGPINHHWTKNVIASPDGKHLYVTSGSNSNVAENGMEAEENRAAILEVDPRTRTLRLFASGLRNPNGLAWQPDSGALWTAVNERDEIGSDLVPDYMTSVQAGGFYGWPYSYYGQHVDVRVKPQRPELVARAIVRTMPWARTPPRSAWPSTKGHCCRSAMPRVPSSASTVPGTASRAAATRSCSFPSAKACRPGRPRTCSAVSSTTRARPWGVRSVSR